jgi:aminopeptidase-like protein
MSIIKIKKATPTLINQQDPADKASDPQRPRNTKEGKSMFRLAEELWPLGRSLSGEGVRQTIDILKRENPMLASRQFPSGEKVSDWEIPMEWNVSAAKLIGPNGEVICNYSENNLHLLGYSVPFSGTVSLAELLPHLHSLPEQPDAIPYATSYYQETWGFCITDNQKNALKNGLYQIEIDSSLKAGNLDYGELYIEGKSNREILFSTYICHPSMANNELSGPVLATELARYVTTLDPYFSYRFLFIPETIGSIAYISQNFNSLKSNLLAGFVLTCVGDDRTFSYLPSRQGGTVADRAALAVLTESGIDFRRYGWGDRGSDERQYCAPGVDLPVCSIMRSKYGEYPEYHTNLDRLGTVVTAEGLQGSFDIYSSLIDYLEKRRYPKITTFGEPQLGRRGLYPNTSIKGVYAHTRKMMDAISQMDGTCSVGEIASIVGASEEEIQEICVMLANEGLVSL